MKHVSENMFLQFEALSCVEGLVLSATVMTII